MLLTKKLIQRRLCIYRVQKGNTVYKSTIFQGLLKFSQTVFKDLFFKVVSHVLKKYSCRLSHAVLDRLL